MVESGLIEEEVEHNQIDKRVQRTQYFKSIKVKVQ